MNTVNVYRVYLDSQGYAAKRGQLSGIAGMYFGTGPKVWAIVSDHPTRYVRADSLAAAKVEAGWILASLDKSDTLRNLLADRPRTKAVHDVLAEYYDTLA